jgi:hypothetical protein
MGWNRTLGPLLKVQASKTGAQTKTALKAASLDTNAQLQLVGVTGCVTTAEAGKYLYLWEESGTIPLVRISLGTAGAFVLIFSEEGIPLLPDKDLQWQSDATTGVVEFTALYRFNPPGGA